MCLCVHTSDFVLLKSSVVMTIQHFCNYYQVLTCFIYFAMGRLNDIVDRPREFSKKRGGKINRPI